ncbi:putative nuclease HARBI1 [Onthophagus taurus]|uniref:putative nuclease HARBI1 n=1 Tax=Onthophagus taurus TaxID=166361 RepID=UPI0039BE44D7
MGVKRELSQKTRYREIGKLFSLFSHIKLLKELEVSSTEDYNNFLRMDLELFHDLLFKVKPFIEKQNTQMRDSISPQLRLSTTLRYLAGGATYEDLKFLTAIAPQTIGKIVIETCEAIISTLKEYIQMPRNEEAWKEIASNFNSRWNFPNCLGAIDGKHVAIKKPANSGSHYFNYKKTHSIVLMLIADANYEIIMADIGSNGRISDGGVFTATKFYERLQENRLKLPDPIELPNFPEKVPYVFIADDAFPLKEHIIMKPYSRRALTLEEDICNYRISRARWIVENVFGILASRFRVLLTTINLSPEKSATIVLACCYLHNYLSKNRGQTYREGNIRNENTHSGEELLPINNNTNTRNSTLFAKEVRDKFHTYFNTVGAVPFQQTV